MTHNDHAERALLSCLLTPGPATLLDDVQDLVTEREFYQPRHGQVWDAIMAVHARGDRVDPITLPVPANLRPLVLELVSPDVPVSASQAPHYAQQVVDAAVRRRLVEAGTKVVQLGQSDADPLQAAQDALQAVTDATNTVQTREAGTTAADTLEATMDWLEADQVGAPTPWADVNDFTNGLLAGQMVTVAARPGHGKSLALKDVAVFAARQGRPAHIATLEMTRHEYMARALAGLSRVDLGRVLRRKMSDNDWLRMGEAGKVVSALPLYIDDRPRQSMAQIRASARQTKRRYGDLGVVCIDYLQLVQPADTRVPREQQVAGISRDVKLLAMELECPVLIAAQLNRGNTQRTDHTPLVSDLRESGALEQDSDQVWLLHRPDQYPGGDDRLGEVDLIVGKNRNGPSPVTVPLAFQGHYATLASLA